MRLVAITLRNFRCYKDEKMIEIGNLTTFIGRNDIGKSTILEALEIFFNNSTVKIENTDCSINAEDKIIEITCEFTDLPERIILDAQAETTLAREYLTSSDGNLRIRKVFNCGGSKPKEEVYICAYHPTRDRYDDLLLLNNTGLKQRFHELNLSSDGVSMNSNPSIRQAIWNSCDDLLLSEVLIPVAKEDGKRIWEKLSEHLPLYALFQSDRPSRDSDAEVQDPMKFAINAALAEPEIQQKLKEVVEAVRMKAMEIATHTHKVLSQIDPSLAARLSPDFKSEPKWANIFSLTLNSDDGIPVNKRGSGVRRLILVSFFKAEAERRLTESGKKSIIYAVEEPETSQHPRNQRVLLEALQDLAAEPGCQMLLTTHSPGLASYLPVESFRFINRDRDNQPRIEIVNRDTWEGIVESLGVVPDNRVRVLLCVEGPTDVQALRALSRALNEFDPSIPNLLCDPRIAFVVLGGGTLSHWVNQHYLKELGRPEVHIYDSDVQKYAEEVAAVNSRKDGSWGVLTKKREIENYLHEDAIYEGLGVRIPVNDFDDIPKLFLKYAPKKYRNPKRVLAT